MVRQPLILITASVEQHGVEFHDLSASLSLRYNQAILQAGGIPVTMPATTDSAVLEALRTEPMACCSPAATTSIPGLYEENVPRKIIENGGADAGWRRAGFGRTAADPGDFPATQAGAGHLPRPSDAQCGLRRQTGR